MLTRLKKFVGATYMAFLLQAPVSRDPRYGHRIFKKILSSRTPRVARSLEIVSRTNFSIRFGSASGVKMSGDAWDDCLIVRPLTNSSIQQWSDI